MVLVVGVQYFVLFACRKDDCYVIWQQVVLLRHIPVYGPRPSYENGHQRRELIKQKTLWPILKQIRNFWNHVTHLWSNQFHSPYLMLLGGSPSWNSCCKCFIWKTTMNGLYVHSAENLSGFVLYLRMWELLLTVDLLKIIHGSPFRIHRKACFVRIEYSFTTRPFLYYFFLRSKNLFSATSGNLPILFAY